MTNLIDTYLSSLVLLPASHKLRSLIICGPEMPLEHQAALKLKAAVYPQVQIDEFTDDLMSYSDSSKRSDSRYITAIAVTTTPNSADFPNSN
ncbi:MAG: hypothetical protein V7K77_23880 [Nostoc sp.]|uniref:hypothetical protein n=1 Tax=Nostoc sp. TaxID=1180 RepID=UPI002FF629AA